MSVSLQFDMETDSGFDYSEPPSVTEEGFNVMLIYGQSLAFPEADLRTGVNATWRAAELYADIRGGPGLDRSYARSHTELYDLFLVTVNEPTADLSQVWLATEYRLSGKLIAYAPGWGDSNAEVGLSMEVYFAELNNGPWGDIFYSAVWQSRNDGSTRREIYDADTEGGVRQCASDLNTDGTWDCVPTPYIVPGQEFSIALPVTPASPFYFNVSAGVGANLGAGRDALPPNEGRSTANVRLEMIRATVVGQIAGSFPPRYRVLDGAVSNESGFDYDTPIGPVPDPVVSCFDLNGDGVVDSNDVMDLIELLGGAGVHEPPPGVDFGEFIGADQNGDGDVDLADFANLLNGLGH